ncbi:MAG: hypothetical protein FWG65_10205 [Turicibacter sp.]|nr:hypothetical protein [Turicibacter sp.]
MPDFYSVTYRNHVTGEELVQKFPIIKLWEYNFDELIAQNKAVLLPFVMN